VFKVTTPQIFKEQTIKEIGVANLLQELINKKQCQSYCNVAFEE
jgi:hypothetical protein